MYGVGNNRLTLATVQPIAIGKTGSVKGAQQIDAATKVMNNVSAARGADLIRPTDNDYEVMSNVNLPPEGWKDNSSIGRGSSKSDYEVMSYRGPNQLQTDSNQGGITRNDRFRGAIRGRRIDKAPARPAQDHKIDSLSANELPAAQHANKAAEAKSFDASRLHQHLGSSTLTRHNKTGALVVSEKRVRDAFSNGDVAPGSSVFIHDMEDGGRLKVLVKSSVGHHITLPVEDTGDGQLSVTHESMNRTEKYGIKDMDNVLTHISHRYVEISTGQTGGRLLPAANYIKGLGRTEAPNAPLVRLGNHLKAIENDPLKTKIVVTKTGVQFDVKLSEGKGLSDKTSMENLVEYLESYARQDGRVTRTDIGLISKCRASLSNLLAEVFKNDRKTGQNLQRRLDSLFITLENKSMASG